MARHWIKLWVEILSDPKVAKLPDWQWRRFVEMLLLAGYQDSDGILPPVSDISWMLHASEQKIVDALIGLTKVGVVHQSSDGTWVVTNFNKRQETPAAERMRRMRAKNQGEQERNSDGNSDGNNASASSSDSDSSNKGFTIQNLSRLYEMEVGSITFTISEKLKAAYDDYPHEWFKYAFEESARNNKRSWAYVEAILKRWKAEGFQNKNGRPRAPTANKQQSGIEAERERLRKEQEAKQNGDK